MKIFEILGSCLLNLENISTDASTMNRLSKLLEPFELIPNTVMINVSDQMGTRSLLRPQFFSVNDAFRVTFLPDRIEILFYSKDLNQSLDIDQVIFKLNSIFTTLSEFVTNKSNRLVLVIRCHLDNIKHNMISNEFTKGSPLIEWNTRQVQRTNITFNGNEEIINLLILNNFFEQGLSVNIEGQIHNVPNLMVEIDINTYQYNTDTRFRLSDYSYYSEVAKRLFIEKIKSVEEYYYE